ncbi:MAG TPA: transketolase C-terminal domain-containing protein, partial [Pirellulaceae bacterium]|nr:transketolase C-terminal domain-containing protein [Pirellulaceae bacterium]
HAVAFAAGQAKAGLRPIVDIYSTFLQRSYDQIFQEVALQNLPVVFTLDRAGLTGPDGPTHHGCFDLAYMRCLPNLVVMAPGDAWDVPAMLDFALAHGGPIALRYPKANAYCITATSGREQCITATSGREEYAAATSGRADLPSDSRPMVAAMHSDRQPVELGRSEAIRPGCDGTILCLGTLLAECLKAAQSLAAEGVDVAVVNARFAKPIDREMVERAIRETGFVLTVEEGCLLGGFGSAVLETASDLGLDASRVRRLGIPDQFIEHGERGELLADLHLDAAGIAAACRELAAQGQGIGHS